MESMLLREYRVVRIRFGADFDLSADGTLTLDPERLVGHLRRDGRLESVAVELAHPGERLKIVGVIDSAEPRCFTDPAREAFPGVGAPPRINAGGTLVCLRGSAVVLCGWEPWFDENTRGVQTPYGAFIDMAGEGALHCLNADTANIVVTIRAGSEPGSYAELARDTIVRSARFIAKQIVTREPGVPFVERLLPAASPRDAKRVVYIDQIRDQGPFVGTFLYGWPLTALLPTLLTPGQLFEGALVSGDYRGALGVATYLHQNNPYLGSLLDAQERGRLRLAGIVLSRGNFESVEDKRRSAELAAHLAIGLDADGVVLSMEGLGNATVDFMETIAACRRRGLRTVGVVHEPLVNWSDEATHLVSIGAEPALGEDAGIERREVVFLEDGVTRAGALRAVSASGSRALAPFCMLWKQGDAGVTCRDY